MSRILMTIAIFGSLATAGCSGGAGLYPVRGTVTSNGQPCEGALVYFHPKNDSSMTAVHAMATTQADGSFTLECNLGIGVPPGDYVVTLSWPKSLVTAGGKEDDFTDRFKGRYTNAKTSGLSATVKAEPNVIPPFVLK